MLRIIFVIISFFVVLSLLLMPSIDAAKTLTVTQNCENTVLMILITNQDGNPVNNAKILDGARNEVHASTDENGFVALPGDLQGQNLRAGGGSYSPTGFIAKDCQPVEINFEKTDHDIVIVHHHSWSDFDPTQDYSDIPEFTPYSGKYIVGDILNLSEQNLTDIEITIQTVSGNSGTVETSTWYPIKKILRPGEASPFFALTSGGFNSYKIFINTYKGTSEIPTEPPVKISNVIIDKNQDGEDSLTIFCENTLEKSNDLQLLLLGYSQQNRLETATIGSTSMWFESGKDTSYCIEKGKVSAPDFIDYAKNNRFEVFIIKSGLTLFFDANEVKKQDRLNAYQNKDLFLTQFPIYSTYFSDSLTPKYMDIQAIRSTAERHSELMKSREGGNPIQDNSVKSTSNSIPDWVRGNAKWWAQGAIGDSDFVSGIQYLIKEGIMTIPETAKGEVSSDSQEIPSWIKNNADWWAQGLISDDDFVKGIQYLIENGILEV